MKAEFTGCCQVCGRRQALPYGRLSKHGYTTALGFFQGVCHGAGYLPFEQAYDRVEFARDCALGEAARLRLEAAQVRLPGSTGVDTAWVHYYHVDSRKGMTGYRWSLLKVEMEVHSWGGRSFRHALPAGQRNAWGRVDIYSHPYPQSVADLIAALNEKRAMHLEKIAAEAEAWAKEAQRRIDNWQPGELVRRAA